MKKSKDNRLVVAPGGWGESLPPWLLKAIEKDRVTDGMVSLMNDKQQTVGDAEVCAYLSTLSLSRPLDHDTAQIYIYLTAKIMKQEGIKIIDFMQQKLDKGLNSDQERELQTIRDQLYSSRGGEVTCGLFDLLKQLKNTRHECLARTG